jgi:uncharacterized protein (TIGR00369 family)
VRDSLSYTIPIEETLDGLLGAELVEADADHAVARFTVENKHRQAFGLVHGGVYSAVAEGLCSGVTAMVVAEDGKVAVGSSNLTSFLRPVTHGVVTASAHAVHRGRTTWVWECEFTNEDGKRCAITRVTLAVIDRPKGV